MARIEAVEAWWLRAEIPASRQHVSDFGRMPHFSTCLVRVTDSDGRTGFGEGKVHVGSAGHYAGIAALVNEELGPLLIGEEAGDIGRSRLLMQSGSRAHHAEQSGRAHPVLGRRGVTVSAMSGIDLALWDLLGRTTALPLYQLLGGRCRDRIRAYASGGWGDLQSLPDEVRSYAGAGYTAVKIRAGRADGPLEQTRRRIEAAREALGPEIDLMIDAHGTLSLPEAKRLCRMVEECRLAWFEEPTAIEERQHLAELRQWTDIPIAAGESEQTRFAFRELLEQRCIDIAQPDLSICGGLSEAREIAALCSAYSIPIAPHMWGGPVLTAAALHFALATPSAVIAEQCMGCNPLLEELTDYRFTPEDGCLTAPPGSGTGIELDLDRVRSLAVTGFN